MKRSTILLATAVFSFVSAVWADAPKLINFQGRLIDGSRNPVADGNYSVTFRIYNVLSGGAALWSETQTVLTTGGIFNALLGSSTTLPASAFDDTTRYLSIQVSPDPEMTPRQRLATVGYSFASNPWGTSGNDVFKLNGNIGIGTAAPNQKFQVVENTSNQGNAAGVGIWQQGSGDAQLNFRLPGIAEYGMGIDQSDGNKFKISDYTSVGNFGSKDRLVINPSGNVGIGTTSPAQKLDVAGTVQMTGFKLPTGAVNGFVLTSDASGVGTWQAASSGASGWMDDGSVVRLTTGSDAVGIGTTTPTKKLEVAGSVKVNDTVFASNVSSNSPLRLQTAGNTRMYFDDASGNVGIGTTNPLDELHVQAGLRITGNGLGFGAGDMRLGGQVISHTTDNLHLRPATGKAVVIDAGTGLDVKGNLEAGTGSRGAIFSSTFNDNFQLRTFTNTPNPNFEIAQGDGSGGSAFTWISGGSSSLSLNPGSGNVGVGTTTPQSKLQVVGNYIQIPVVSTAPLLTDCDEAGEAGRMVVYIDPTFGFVTLYICGGTNGWVGK